MTMTLPTSQHQRFATPLNFDYAAHAQPPAFSNPWSSSSSPPHSNATAGASLYVASQQQAPVAHPMMAAKPQQSARASTSSASSMAPYTALPVATTSADIIAMNRLHTTSAAYGDPTYTASASPVSGHFAPTSAPSRQPAFAMSPETERRFSQQQNMQAQVDERRSFADALDASHIMLAMSQETPRNIYGPRNNRSSVDSYGFPSTHSTSSSISSTGNFSSYYGDSVSDYSTAGSDIESVNSRTLPRPQGLMGSQLPPAPQ